MSFSCRVLQPAIVRQALATLSLGKEPWATFIFTGNSQGVVVHCSSPDESITGTTVLPQELFADYKADSNVCIVAPVSSLVDALSLGLRNTSASAAAMMTTTTYTAGAGAAATAPGVRDFSSKITLSYPNAHGRLLVEVVEGGRTASCQILTKATKDRLLDLRFDDQLCPNTVFMKGEVAREVIFDLQAFSADRVALQFTPTSLQFHGLNSPQGSIHVEVARATDAVISFDVRETSLQARFLMSHVLQAFACTSKTTANMDRSAGGGGAPHGGGGAHGHNASALGGGGTTQLGAMPPGLGGGLQQFGGFAGTGLDKVALKVNAERQLQVIHYGKAEVLSSSGGSAHPSQGAGGGGNVAGDGTVTIQVKMTVNPLSLLLDE